MRHLTLYGVFWFLSWLYIHECLASEVQLSANPATITKGLTESLKLRCALQTTLKTDCTVTRLKDKLRMERMTLYFVLCIFCWTHFHKCLCSEVKLTATPSTITNGLTDSLKLRCSLQDTTDASSMVVGRQVSITSYDIEHVNSIIISRVNPDETVTSLAEIITSENANVLNDHQTVTVLGTLTPSDPADPEYLELTWTDPGEEQSGSYICEVNGLDPEGHGVMLQKSMAVNSADPEVKDLVKEFKNLKASLQDLVKENNDLKAIVATHKAPHTEGGKVQCGNSDSWPSVPGTTSSKQRVIPVTFKRPYSSLPVISIADVAGDFSLDSTNNLGHHWYVSDVTTTGFNMHCKTWSGTHYGSKLIAWTSFVA